jgi:hypothetical protein
MKIDPVIEHCSFNTLNLATGDLYSIANSGIVALANAHIIVDN